MGLQIHLEKVIYLFIRFPSLIVFQNLPPLGNFRETKRFLLLKKKKNRVKFSKLSF